MTGADVYRGLDFDPVEARVRKSGNRLRPPWRAPAQPIHDRGAIEIGGQRRVRFRWS